MVKETNFKVTLACWTKRLTMAASISLLLFSCELHYAGEKVQTENLAKQADGGDLSNSAITKSFMIAQLNLTVSPQATGTVTLELRTQAGVPIFQATRSVSGMTSKGMPTWYSFNLFTAHTFSSQTPLRLYVSRSDSHNAATGNTIFISTSSGNDYLNGDSSVPGKDLSFMTYTSVTNTDQPGITHYNDQMQTRVRERQPITNNGYVWQEFLFGNSTSNSRVGILTNIQLPLSTVFAQTGNFHVWIMNSQGTVVAEEIVIPASQIPIGGSTWTNIQLTNPLIVQIGQKYRMQFMHSGSPDEVTELIGIGLNTFDEYRHGICSLSSEQDFAFKTFLDSSPDQVQNTYPLLFLIPLNTPYWQEFVPGANQ